MNTLPAWLVIELEKKDQQQIDDDRPRVYAYQTDERFEHVREGLAEDSEPDDELVVIKMI